MAAPVKLSKLLVLVKVQTLIPIPAPAVLLLRLHGISLGLSTLQWFLPLNHGDLLAGMPNFV